MNAAQFQRHPLRSDPLFAAGMDKEKVFLPVLEKTEIAARVALFGRHLRRERRRHPAGHRGGDKGLDAIERVDGDALALPQPVHQLTVIDRAAAERRFRHVGVAAEFGYLAQDILVFHWLTAWARLV